MRSSIVKYAQILFLVFWTMCLQAQIYTLKDINRLHTQGLSIDIAFGIRGNAVFETDTAEMQAKLAPLKELYRQGKTEFGIAYYVLLAEGFAAYYDRVNDRTAFYFHKARELARSKDDDTYELLIDIRHGNYHFAFRDIIGALPFFLRAEHKQQKHRLSLLPQAGLHIKMIASFFGYIGNNNKAISLYKKAGRLDHVTSRERIDAISAAGVFSLKLGDLDSAEKYYKHARSWAEKSRDSVWIGILEGNLGKIDLIRRDTSSALQRLKVNLALSQKHRDAHDAMRTALSLGILHGEMKSWSQAERYLNQARYYFKDRPFFLEYRTNALKLQSDILLAKGHREAALDTLQLYILFRDSLQQRIDNDNLNRIIWQTESEHYEKEIHQNEVLYHKNQIIYFSVGTLIVLVLFVLLLLLNRSKQRIKIRALQTEQERLSLHFEKIQVDDMLDKAQESMKVFVNTIEQNDREIERLRQELRESGGKNMVNLAETRAKLSEMLKSHVMTDDRWYKFKSLFIQVYPRFLEQQQQQSNDLTEANRRLLILQHLELSNKTIANLLGISIDGVKKAKIRLKQKITNNNGNQ